MPMSQHALSMLVRSPACRPNCGRVLVPWRQVFRGISIVRSLQATVRLRYPAVRQCVRIAARSAKGPRRNPSLWKLTALKATIEARRQELWKRIDEIHALIFRLKEKSVELAAAGETPKIDLLAAREMLVAESDRLMAEIIALEDGKSPKQGDA